MEKDKKIPYWHQTSEVSCGPSCLLMIFNYYNPKYGLSRKKEFELWRECSLLVWRGTHPYGLAASALKRGYEVEAIREKKTMWKDPNFPVTNNPLKFIIKMQEKKAKSLGLKEKIIKNIKLEDLKEILNGNFYPIVLIMFIKGKKITKIPHWVVVLEIKKDYVIIHDSYDKANRKVPISLFIGSWNAARRKAWGHTKEVLIIKK